MTFLQLLNADIILLNKADLVGHEKMLQLEQRVLNALPSARVFRATHAKVGLTELLQLHYSSSEAGVGVPSHEARLMLQVSCSGNQPFKRLTTAIHLYSNS